MKAHRIEGTTALVTGANRGIGRAIVDALLERGAKKVYACARDPKTIQAQPRVVPVALDVTNEAQLRALDVPDVELVVNNAGVSLVTSMAGPDVLEHAQREMEVNYFGPLRVIERLGPVVQANGGAIVNVGSAAGLTNVPFLPTYSASKAALHSLTQAVRILFRGASVFGVYAGPVDTDMVRALTLPKSAPRDVAHAILDGVEQGTEDIFPDPFSQQFAQRFLVSPKGAEEDMAKMATSG